MGFIDFVKSAGEKLFGGDEPEEPQVAAPDPEAIRQATNRRVGMGLVKAVERTGLAVEDLSIRVDGDVATVSGTVHSQEDKEKVVLAVGNNLGIARVDDRLEIDRQEPEAVYYTVQSGDSLSKIAKEHYGNAMEYPRIFEANKPMLSDPDKIYPGQVLRIPPEGAGTSN